MSSSSNHSEPYPNIENAAHEVARTKLRIQSQKMERKAKTALKVLRELSDAGVEVPVGGMMLRTRDSAPTLSDQRRRRCRQSKGGKL